MIIKNDPLIIQAYLEDSSHLEGGKADKIIIPGSVDEMSLVIREANLRK